METRIKTILLLNMAEAETRLVKKLSPPSGIEIVPLSAGNIREFTKTFPEKEICCIIYHIEASRKRPHRTIKHIRSIVGVFVPLLLLVPKQKSGKIKNFITAGADDFMELPLNEKGFSGSFQTLREMGIAGTGQPKCNNLITDGKTASERADEARAVNNSWARFNCFNRKLLIQKNRRELIANKWQKIKKIGLGGSGDVWLVKDIHCGRLAVAKIPLMPHMNVRALRSAAILKRLGNHPNLVQLIDVVKDRGKIILIQEYVEGSTLQQLMEQPISPKNKEIYLQQLLSVISYCHKHEIVHRDIKPENILISKTGQVKLIDFGIARDLSWQTAGGTSEGTVNFMPPEQLKGQSCIASDVWALGVILYIFTTNTVPFVQQNDQYPVDLEATEANRAPSKINPLVPSGLERIIMTSLQKDPDKRYTSAKGLLDDLENTFPYFGKGKAGITSLGYGLMAPRSLSNLAHRKAEKNDGVFGILQPAYG